jgi:hypothetical protein
MLAMARSRSGTQSSTWCRDPRLTRLTPRHASRGPRRQWWHGLDHADEVGGVDRPPALLGGVDVDQGQEHLGVIDDLGHRLNLRSTGGSLRHEQHHSL